MKSAGFTPDDLSEITGFPHGGAMWDNEGCVQNAGVRVCGGAARPDHRAEKAGVKKSLPPGERGICAANDGWGARLLATSVSGLSRRAGAAAGAPRGCAPICSTSVVPPGRNKFGRGYAKNLPPASFLHAAPVQKKSRLDEQASRLFVSTGVVRIGPAGVDGPAVPSPYPGS